jgi:hypothetical protein
MRAWNDVDLAALIWVQPDAFRRAFELRAEATAATTAAI